MRTSSLLDRARDVEPGKTFSRKETAMMWSGTCANIRKGSLALVLSVWMIVALPLFAGWPIAASGTNSISHGRYISSSSSSSLAGVDADLYYISAVVESAAQLMAHLGIETGTNFDDPPALFIHGGKYWLNGNGWHYYAYFRKALGGSIVGTDLGEVSGPQIQNYRIIYRTEALGVCGNQSLGTVPTPCHDFYIRNVLVAREGEWSLASFARVFSGAQAIGYIEEYDGAAIGNVYKTSGGAWNTYRGSPEGVGGYLDWLGTYPNDWIWFVP